MVSNISVYETPYRIQQLFREFDEDELINKGNEMYIKSARLVEPDPEPNLKSKKWYEKYGDTDMLWKVELVHEGEKNICENKPFRSWEGVERAVKRVLKEQHEYIAEHESS